MANDYLDQQIPIYRAVPYNTVGAVIDRPRAIDNRPYEFF